VILNNYFETNVFSQRRMICFTYECCVPPIFMEITFAKSWGLY